MLSKDQKNALKLLFKSFSDVQFAYLFGSQASGKVTPLSDVDIAVQFDRKRSPNQRFQTRLRLIADLCEILQRQDVDVADLNNSDVVLRYQVVKKGKLIFCRDWSAKNAFFVRTVSEYLDTEPMRAFHREKMKQQIKEGTFFGRSQRFAKAAREAEKVYRAFEIYRTKNTG